MNAFATGLKRQILLILICGNKMLRQPVRQRMILSLPTACYLQTDGQCKVEMVEPSTITHETGNQHARLRDQAHRAKSFYSCTVLLKSRVAERHWPLISVQSQQLWQHAIVASFCRFAGMLFVPTNPEAENGNLRDEDERLAALRLSSKDLRKLVHFGTS